MKIIPALLASSRVLTRNAQDTIHATRKVSIPANFGAPDGPEISNKDTILDDVDRALGVSKPPDIEVILTDHMCNVGNPIQKFLHKNVIRFGHVAIRYQAEGKSQVMNIMGDFSDPDATLVNFFSAEDYIYGTSSKAQQGGVYNRPYVGVRIENVSKGATEALHAYYKALQKAGEIGESSASIDGGNNPGDIPHMKNQGAVRFQLVDVQLSKIARSLPPPLDKPIYKIADSLRSAHNAAKGASSDVKGGEMKFVDEDHPLAPIQDAGNDAMKMAGDMYMDTRSATYIAGNCAQWTSAGLDFVGLIRRPRLFPKAILMELFEEESIYFNRPNNVNLVVYREIQHAQKKWDEFQYLQSAMMHPLRPVRNWWYDEPEKFAHAIVTVPEGTMTAIAEKNEPVRKPEQWLRWVSYVSIYAPAAVLVGAFDSIGPIGPTGAAIWLAANYWLH